MRNTRQLSVFLVWDEFTSQNFRFHLLFPTLSLIREMLSTQPSVRREALSLYVFYILFFFRVSLFGGVFTVFLHIWSIPCMLIIGLGFIYLFVIFGV